MIRLLFVLGLFLLGSGGAMAQKKLVADRAKSSVTYAMRHALHKWEGTSREVNAALVLDDATKQIRQVAVAMRVASFNSKNESRDSHMIEVLDGLSYPNVTFTSQDIKAAADGTLTATGKLTFHNVTRPVTVQVRQREAGGQLLMDGSFPLKMTDYKVERPSFLGIVTQDDFTLSFALVFPN